MFVEDPEKFKSWLTMKLEPLCEADPAALAKYVYALVKKDKPTDELKKSMTNQLQIFLQSETAQFVEVLFRALEVGKFSEMSIHSGKSSDDSTLKTDKSKKKSNTPSIIKSSDSHDSSDSDLRDDLILSVHSNGSTGKRESPSREEEKDSANRGSTLRSRACRGSSASLSPEGRRIVRSPYYRRRSRSGSQSRDRDRSLRWRNKSPPRRFDSRRRSYSRSPRIISRSPPPKRGRYRNRSPPRTPKAHSRSPISLVHSFDMDAKKSSESTSRDLDSRFSAPQSENLKPCRDSNKAFDSVTRRCRDYDEKGFCMRGDLCPFDHGSDPVILEDISPSTLFDVTAAAALSASALAVNNPPVIPPSHLLHESSPTRLDYNNPNIGNEPRFWRRHHRGAHYLRNSIRGGLSRGVSTISGLPKRELISVVTSQTCQESNLQNQKNQAHAQTSGLSFNQNGREKLRFEPYNPPVPGRRVLRVGPSINNCTLQLKKVPISMNNITHLNNHFAKFGKILNITVGFDNDPESALITFSTHGEANSAYKSTEAVLNNRFIKVFWHHSSSVNNENKSDNVSPSTTTTANPESLSPPRTSLNNISPNVTTPAPENKESMLKMELSKRKRELLEKQLTHQKVLIQRLESGAVKPPQKTVIMKTVKTLQESIEKLKKDLSDDMYSSNYSIMARAPPKDNVLSLRKSREETQRQLLDAELDLLKQEQIGGGNVSEIKKKIADLKIKAMQMKIPIPRSSSTITGGCSNLPFYRGRGGSSRSRGSSYTSVRGRGNAAIRFPPHCLDYNVVDHRPTKLLVSGYESDDKADVLTHFSKYGEIINYTSDDATPSIILNYKSRKEAELALSKGRNFQDRLLSVTWATPNHNVRPGVTTQNTIVPAKILPINEELRTPDEEELLGLSPPDSLLQDEEDEDEKSWRR